MRQLHVFTVTAVVVATSALCAGQSIISAKSGTLHYFQGDVSIDGEEVHAKMGIFPDVRPGSVLRTERGRAEVLLTPGVFLRVGDNTAIRMLDANLSHTRVELMSGTAMVESDDPKMSVQNAPVTIVYKDTAVQIVKHGLVEINADSGDVKVFKGEAQVADNSGHILLKDGNSAPLTGDLKVQKFDTKDPDDLFVWSRDRSIDLSAANMYAAGALNSGTGYGYAGAAPWGGGWYYNNWFNMFTFVPATGMLLNPWGYGFYSPVILGYGVPLLGGVGRPIGGSALAAVGPSPITRLVGGTSGTGPALGNAARAGFIAAQPASAGSSGGRGGGAGLAMRGAGGTGHSGGGHR